MFPIHWVLCSFYAFYFATLGAVLPFLGLYLESISFNPKQIGYLMSILLITKILAPNFWGYFLDSFSEKYPLLKTYTLVIALICSSLAFFALNFTTQFWLIVIFVAIYSFFWNAVLPQMETFVYNHLGENKHRYGRIRVWGSIGFILSVISLGWSIDQFGISFLIPSVSVLFFVLALHGAFLKEMPTESIQHNESLKLRKMLTPMICIVLFLGMVTQMTHAPFYTFFSIYLESYDYSKTLIGVLWAFGVIMEIGVFLCAHLLFKRFNIFNLLMFCFAMTALRWWLLSHFAESILWLFFAQSLHAISFGLYHSCASQLINDQFVGNVQVRGQALYSSVTFGIGGAIGTLWSGILWTEIGGQSLFLLCAITMVLATLCAGIFTIFLKR